VPPDIVDPRRETLVDALDVLGDLRVWELADEKWASVERIVVSMAAALRANDVQRLRETTAKLELLAPGRITRIGASAYVPAPPRVRALADDLVHVLTTSIQEQERASARGRSDASSVRDGSPRGGRRTAD
jgi:hypothetical protein